MQSSASPCVVVVMNDLMFQVKIDAAAKQAGVTVRFVKSKVDALHLAAQKPSLIILDLNYSAAEPLALITALKSDETTQPIPLLGYVSHVQMDLRREASALGCDMVVPRSVFVSSLPDLLTKSCS